MSVANAATYHVWTNSPADGPGTDWTNAFRTIQAAVSAATDGDTVLVTNGVYDSGGMVTPGSTLTNRVRITNAITVRSVNGPRGTFIVGSGPCGDDAVRCVYLASNAVLAGFTLTNGHTRGEGDQVAERSGGGAWCASDGAAVSNCVLTGNEATDGGGAYGGSFHSCLFVRNSAPGGVGGGACGAALNNCTVVANSADYAGGTAGGTIENCIIFYNSAAFYPNWSGGEISHACTTPEPNGDGNITNEPWIATLDMPLLMDGSPCIDMGTNRDWMADAVDLDGEPRLNGNVDIGADEHWANSLTGALSAAISAAYTQAVPGFAVMFEAQVQGRPQGYAWDFDDGETATNLCRLSHAFAAVGVYDVVLRATNSDNSASATVTVEIVAATNIYVAPGGDDGNPGTSWPAAKATIQAGVDASLPGGTVWVSNGVYATGGAAGCPAGSALTNRVAVYKPVAVRSVNGPDETSIVGEGPEPGSVVRGVCMVDGAQLIGFTITNGHTLSSGSVDTEQSGGGVWCQSPAAIVSNCVLTGNEAIGNGGGARYGTLTWCTLAGNMGWNGGGAHGSTLRNCLLTGNAAAYGGGANAATLCNCVLTDNSAGIGGGTHGSDMKSCTVVGNRANEAGGAMGAYLRDCLVYYNKASSCDNWSGEGDVTYTCTTPLPPGEGNFDAAPLVVSVQDPHLLGGSPCIDAGADYDGMGDGVDIDGEIRTNGVVDIGADEYWAGGRTGVLSAAMWVSGTQAVMNTLLEFEALFDGAVDGYVWDFGDGTFVSNLCVLTHAFPSGGTYVVTLTATNQTDSATAATIIVILPTPRLYYVSTNGSDAWAGTNWATAKKTIQAAVDAAGAGDVVFVSNGVYSTGGAKGYPSGSTLTNRVAVYKPLTIQSMDGPEKTFIVGAGPLGNAAVRCVYLAGGAHLIGFTLMNGFTRNLEDWYSYNTDSGGGAWCASTNAWIRDSTICGCWAGKVGGGFYGGVGSNVSLFANTARGGGGACKSILTACMIASNGAAEAGGAGECVLLDCDLVGNAATGYWGYAPGGGGGAGRSVLESCRIRANRAGYGGGLYFSTARNCLLEGNIAACIDWGRDGWGGGACFGSLEHCTVVSNSAGYFVGGTWYSVLRNCIVQYNASVRTGADNVIGTNIYHSCFGTPWTNLLGPAYGNITNDPQFVNAEAGDYQLQDISPCIDAGTNLPGVFDDLDGVPRPLDGDANGSVVADMGCYESVNAAADSDGDTMRDRWELDHDLDPADPFDRSGDPDSDSCPNDHEHIADTDPHDGNSFFRVTDITRDSPVTVHFDSSAARLYSLQGVTNLVDGVWANVPGAGPSVGAGGADSMTDTNEPPAGPIYRMEVELP